MAMTPTELADALTKTGWKKPGLSTGDALREYQDWFGIEATDLSVTERHLKLERFCGFPDNMEAFGAAVPKWTKRHLRWGIVDDLPNIPRNVYQQAIADAWTYITRYCNLTVEYVEAGQVDVQIKTMQGRPLGVLAQAEIPYPPDRQRTLEVDLTENWIVSNNPPQGYIVLVIVLIHELLHIVGVLHTNIPNQIMNPTYNPRIAVPQQAFDIAQIVGLYGPRTTPIPPPTGPTTERIELGTRKGKVTWDA